MSQHWKWRLVLPLVVAASIWPICFGIPYLSYLTGGSNPRANPEGAALLAAFVSVLLFAFAGPFTGFVLSKIMTTQRLGLAAFIGSFFLVTSPMLCFQAIVYSFSALSPFLHFMVTDQTLNLFHIRAAILGACIYAAFSLVLYAAAMRGVMPATATAIVIFACSCAIMVTQVLHRFI